MHVTPEYLELAEAIAEAPSIPPCIGSDPEVWFGDMEEGYNYARTAKKLCAQCPVRVQCLTYALKAREQHGIWGGLTLRERQRLLNRPLIRPRAA